MCLSAQVKEEVLTKFTGRALPKALLVETMAKLEDEVKIEAGDNVEDRDKAEAAAAKVIRTL